jgi:SAM-dependent methyltransferase
MHCPYCGSALSLRDAGAGSGIATCACGRHPVLDGVLCLADDRAPVGSSWRWVRVLELLGRAEARGALAHALGPQLRTKAGRACALVLRSGFGPPARLARRAQEQTRRLVLDRGDLTFAQAVALLRHPSYAAYLVHRYANPSIIAATALLGVLPELARRLGRPVRVLDLGGGAGHASFLISRLVPGAQVVLADRDVGNLYAAGRFLCPGAARVCLDAEAPLPFPDGFFDCVFTLDSFHYVRSKIAAVREMRRALAPHGLLLFAHLHNSSRPNPAAGTPVSGADYRRIIGGDVVLKREDQLLDAFLARARLDLRADDAGLDEANAFLAADGPAWLRSEFDLSGLFETPEPVRLSPTYRIEGARAVRRFPSPVLERECAAIAAYTPDHVELEPHTAAHLMNGGLPGDAPEAAPLRRALVAIPLPERYA